MKTTSPFRSTAAALAIALGALTGQAHAQTDIAPAPLAQSSASVVKPNIMFILDDSGSMDRDYMPDSVPGNYCKDDDNSLDNCQFGMPAYNAAQFNTLAYNPTIVYTPPINYDGTSFQSYNTNALWQVVPNDGFGVQFTGTINLLTDYPDLVYCTTGSPSTAQRTAPFTNATTCRMPIQSGVWTYPNATAFSQQNVAGNRPPYYYAITGVTWCTDRDGTAGFGTGTFGSTTAPACGSKQDAPVSPGSATTLQYPRFGSAGNNGFTRVDIVSTTANYPRSAGRTDCTGAVGPTGCTYAQEMTNFANWYAYYRTRMQMMKSSAGLAFKGITDSYRVGFVTINPGNPVATTKYLPISDFTSGSGNQKDKWYDILYDQNPGPSTPLREALSRVGRHFANKTNGINSGMSQDPVQYSCQQNFALLTTDGYWNGNAGVNLSGNAIGNVDNNPTTAPRPLLDGSFQRTTTTTNATLTQAVCTSNNSVFGGGTTCGCAAGSNFKRVKQQTFNQVNTQVSRDGIVSSNTNSNNTTYQNITACNATVTTTVTPNRRIEQVVVAGNAQSTFGAVNGVTAGMNEAGACPTTQVRIKQRTTDWNSTVIQNDGATQSTTASGTVYAFANVGSCVNARVRQVYDVTETTEVVMPEATGNTAFPAPANGDNDQTTYTCSGSGTRVILLRRVFTYTRTEERTGATLHSTSYTNNSNATFSTVQACSTTAKTAAAPIINSTLSSVTYVSGGPTPAATTNQTFTPSSTSTGATITDADRTIPGGGPQVVVTSNNVDGPAGFADTLADVAQYYYINDLRANGSLGVAVGTPATQLDVGTDNNVPGQASTDPQNDSASHQHMTTFTLGLGLDGTMTYNPDYRTNPTGDFLAIKNGTANWPQPVGDTLTAVDDLWHAAVNGRGKYFSAKNPASLSTGLTEALAGVNAVVGTAAAAATSNLEPVPGDNFIYVASYETVTWAGELEALELDLDTAEVGTTGPWTARAQLDTLTNSTTPGGQARNIKRFNAAASNKLEDFTWASLSATGHNTYFEAAWIGSGGSALSQWSSLTSAQQTTAAGANLVSFIRGDSSNERTTSNTAGVYRDRVHALGDIVNAQPLYVKRVTANYGDAGFATFKSCVNFGGTGCSGIFNGPRSPMVFIAANDGMLHALDGDTGAERWAFIPTAVIPNLYKLADTSYATKHQYYVDGSPRAGNVYDPVAGKWKTILVGGLNSGGRGYYALDITDPGTPKALWEFSVRPAAACPVAPTLNVDKVDCDLGLTYGNPIITKLGNGEWVVVVSSGYNNVSPGDGKGYIYVLDPMTGVIKKKIKAANASQGIDPGDTTTSVGLAKINTWVDNVDVNNTALRLYGGDMLGNLWRFDLDAGTAYVVAQVKDPSNVAQPITTRPELTEVDDHSLVLIGTGRYLGATDLTSTQVQTVYGIKDDTEGVAPTSPANARGSTFVSQTITNTTSGTGEAIRTVTSNAVDLDTKSGWRVDLPTSRERVNIDPRLLLGTLIVLSNVPENTACTPGGFSFLNFFDYRTGSYIQSSGSNLVGVRLSALGVGMNVVKLGDDWKLIVMPADKKPLPFDPPIETPNPEGHRSSWRELSN
ncbi:MAG TPA: PilC/PilY family type IV pilus protein [Burkholderiales bacterium]